MRVRLAAYGTVAACRAVACVTWSRIISSTPMMMPASSRVSSSHCAGAATQRRRRGRNTASGMNDGAVTNEWVQRRYVPPLRRIKNGKIKNLTLPIKLAVGRPRGTGHRPGVICPCGSRGGGRQRCRLCGAELRPRRRRHPREICVTAGCGRFVRRWPLHRCPLCIAERKT